MITALAGMAALGQDDLLSYFAVLLRFATFMAVFPLLGDAQVPGPVKVLLSVILATIVYPVLVQSGALKPWMAAEWGATLASLLKTVTVEVAFGLCLGFASKFLFDMIVMTGDLIGNWMGFASASQFDPFYNGQTQVMSKILHSMGMLLFLAMDGHYWLFQAAVGSYQIVGVGQAHFSGPFAETLIHQAGAMIRLALQLSAPLAISFFAMNVVYGIVSRAMPQLNILVLSFSISALVGLFVLTMGLPEFTGSLRGLFADFGEGLWTVMRALSHA